MFGSIFICYRDIFCNVINANTAIVKVVVPVGKSQGVLFVDFPLQAQLGTQFADVLAIAWCSVV